MSETMQDVVSRNVLILMAIREMRQQKDLASKLGWSSSKMTKTFNGDRRWQLEDLAEVADALAVTPGDLLASTAVLVGAVGGTRAVTGVGTDGYRRATSPDTQSMGQVIRFPGSYQTGSTDAAHADTTVPQTVGDQAGTDADAA